MSDWLKKVTALRRRKVRIVAGVMSGTSVDSVDVSLCKIEGCGIPGRDGDGARIKLLGFYSHPYDRKLQGRVRSFAEAHGREMAELHVEIADLFSEAINGAAHQHKLSLEKIDLVGSHGQTVYHHSMVKGAIKATLQLGDGDRIAESIGCPTFFDFRARDIAVGGEGAPLTPYCDLALFLPHVGEQAAVVVLNLGGIANVTALSRDPSKVIGFDVGPANAPLDRLTRIITNGAQDHDVDGKIARSGKLNEALLHKLLSEDLFIAAKPPKSTGFEVYGDGWVKALIDKAGGVSPDLLTLATEFVAQSVARALRNFILPTHQVEKIVVAGGGSKNLFLLERLSAAVTPVAVTTSDTLGIPAFARESMAWALLANDALFGIPTSLPSVTGCSRSVVQGKLAFPK